MLKKIIFDLDDTLVETAEIYRLKIQEFITEFKSDHNFNLLTDKEIWKIQEDIDISEIEEHGFKPERFPLSFQKAYKYLCTEYSLKDDDKLSNKYLAIGKEVHTTIPKLCSGAIDILKYLKSKNYLIAIYTLGDYDIQNFKIESTGLNNYTDEKIIVLHKTVKNLSKVCGSALPEECAIVGDSLKGEIKPALKLGVQPYYVDRPDKWHYLITKVEGNYTSIKKLSELRKYL